MVDNNNGPSGWLRLYVTVSGSLCTFGERCPSANGVVGQPAGSHTEQQRVSTHTSPSPQHYWHAACSSARGRPPRCCCRPCCVFMLGGADQAGVLQSAGGVGAISQVQVRTTGTTNWATLNNDFGSVWEMPNAPSYPLDMNVVGTDGESVRPPTLPVCPGCASRGN